MHGSDCSPAWLAALLALGTLCLAFQQLGDGQRSPGSSVLVLQGFAGVGSSAGRASFAASSGPTLSSAELRLRRKSEAQAQVCLATGARLGGFAWVLLCCCQCTSLDLRTPCALVQVITRLPDS